MGEHELEIIRMLEPGNALKENPDYELHRLTTRTPAFFGETVSRHVESLETELRLLERQADERLKEIEELTGGGGTGNWLTSERFPLCCFPNPKSPAKADQ